VDDSPQSFDRGYEQVPRGPLGLALIALATLLAVVVLETDSSLDDTVAGLIIAAAIAAMGLLLLAAHLALRVAQDLARWQEQQRSRGVDWYR
jgi:hypothetical protein